MRPQCVTAPPLPGNARGAREEHRMTARTAIAIVALALPAAGCGWVGEIWPWGRKSVPVTPPREADANGPAATAADTPPGTVEPAVVAVSGRPDMPVEPLAPQPGRPDLPTMPAPAAGGPTRLAVRPPSKIDQPTNLTDLLRGPRIGPPTTTRPATTRPDRPIPPTPPGDDANTPVRPVVVPARPTGPPEVVVASALQVNNHFITVEEVLRALAPQLKKLPAGISETTFRHRVGPMAAEEIQARISRTLLLAEAEKRLTDQQKTAVDVEVKRAHNQMLAEAGGSKTRLQQKLAAGGRKLEDVLTEHRRMAATRIYLDARFLPAIVVNRKMLWDHYNTRRDEFTTDKKVQMQIVAAPFKAFYPKGVARPSALEKAAARKQARELIEQAHAALRAGEDFGQVARRLSRGIKAAKEGLWPLMRADSFKETAVEKAAFRLAEGEVAGPVETDSGFYLVKAKRVQAGKVVSFEDAQEQITKTLRDRMYRKLTEDYILKLLQGATLGGTERFLRLVLTTAAERYGPK
jgi:hypothetical protein